MSLKFEWDREKAKTNLNKHGISFVEAATIFSDPFSITRNDALNSIEEERFLILGYSDRQRLLVVVYTDRGDNVRIISARIATNRERKVYEEGIE
ncbi:BrnT family toxin [Floridanema evergladense]|uniref:BrnT family toxin n=1 Tax=Floridaenema evergladense BLCC-F167 TaxID=3153639 RepID=A0ABV4WTX9_9CYAN